MSKGKLFVISGPSGSGKTTIVKNVVESLNKIDFSVSCTTRTRRYGEKEGRDYRFISEARFREMIEKGEFLEWAEVYGNLYGTPLSDILNSNMYGRDVILDIDVNGASEIKKNYDNSVFIFILPGSLDELKTRLLSRKNETDINIENRLTTAREEVAQIDNYDYIIINKDIDVSTDYLASIIKAERSRREIMIEYVHENFDLG